MKEDILPESYFKRLDDSSDHDFYSEPRKVVHIDGAAIAALQKYYAKHIPPHGIRPEGDTCFMDSLFVLFFIGFRVNGLVDVGHFGDPVPHDQQHV